MRNNWETDSTDNNYGTIYFSVDADEEKRDTYVALDVGSEVYVEEFDSMEDMERFYENKADYVPGLQVTIFDSEVLHG
ncbi:hypothetical protein [Macrococcoides caseolyticum]|uniref:hypothetical protein n=1 Tax=Macrococcoides caseolyticum TaxID=69966 RepID=UPI000C33650E|nr:hypothetical protein [Macrococcus caseolyticus]PKF08366.1 hypothetical protein CW698_01110 [Macrococcus caseolyticus]